MPPEYLVIVSADRGLYADWLYQEIVELGWHPFLRINHQGQYRNLSSNSWQLLATVVSDRNQNWSGKITCFKTNPINCNLLARWELGYADPWLVITDLDSADADVSWYGFRSWIECSYRDVKSDGFGWHKTRLRQPDRAERHWLAQSLRLRSSSYDDWGSFASRSVAMLWVVTLGSEQEVFNDESSISDRSGESSKFTPTLSCFLHGLLTVVAQLLNGESLTFGRLFPLPFSHFKDLAFANSS